MRDTRTSRAPLCTNMVRLQHTGTKNLICDYGVTFVCRRGAVFSVLPRSLAQQQDARSTFWPGEGKQRIALRIRSRSSSGCNQLVAPAKAVAGPPQRRLAVILTELQPSYASFMEIKASVDSCFRQHHHKFSLKFLRNLMQSFIANALSSFKYVFL
jgi:hypothetical protein